MTNYQIKGNAALVNKPTLNKHQVTLLNSGGALNAFETNSEIDDLLEPAVNKLEFTKRQMQRKKKYDANTYEVKFVSIDDVKLPESHLIENSKLIAKSALSLGADLVPIAGQVKAIKEIYSGVDPITGFTVNKALSTFALIPGGKIAVKTLSWFHGSEMVIKGVNVLKSSKGTIGKHAANASVGGVSAYTGAIATADKHPYRSAAIGAGVGFAFGIKQAPSYRAAFNLGASSGFMSNLVNQGISYENSEIETISISKLAVNSYGGGLMGSLTYGMPLIAGAIINWGPLTVMGKLGDEIL